jgi:hypothetical protein
MIAREIAKDHFESRKPDEPEAHHETEKATGSE